MFDCEETIRFKSEKSEAEVFKSVENALLRIGNTSVNSTGHIAISASKYQDPFTDVSVEGNLRKQDEDYILMLSASIKPTAIDWGIGICFFPLGFAVFLLPSTKKTTLASKFESVAVELR